MSTPVSPSTTDLRAILREAAKESPNSAATSAARLALLRQDVPEAVVQIDAVRADDTAIAVKVTIGRASGGRASAIAAADVDAERSWAEQMSAVEAEAIGRALDLLGMTIERALAGGKQSAPDRPVPQKPAQPSANSGEDDQLAAYSWNAFWQHARTHNVSREQVEQALGRSVQEVSPHEAVEALTAAGLWRG